MERKTMQATRSQANTLKRWCLLAAGLLAAGTGIDAAAHSASRQKMVMSTPIHASAAQVWALVGDFNNWQRWLPMVEATRDAGDGKTPETPRTLVLKDSRAEIVETLDAIDPAAMVLKYRIRKVDIDAFPVNTYSSTITVKANGASDSIVEGSVFPGRPEFRSAGKIQRRCRDRRRHRVVHRRPGQPEKGG
jgi:hypothetical protein